MRMLCYKCNHSWNHKGILTEGKVYVTCPNCMRKIRVDRSLIEDVSKQKLLTNLPKKNVDTTSFPLKLPTTTSFERVSFSDGFNCLVHKNIAKQFEEAPEEEEDDVKDVLLQEQEPAIKILPPKFEIIRIIPRDPIQILEHQRSFV